MSAMTPVIRSPKTGTHIQTIYTERESHVLLYNIYIYKTHTIYIVWVLGEGYGCLLKIKTLIT